MGVCHKYVHVGVTHRKGKRLHNATHRSISQSGLSFGHNVAQPGVLFRYCYRSSVMCLPASECQYQWPRAIVCKLAILGFYGPELTLGSQSQTRRPDTIAADSSAALSAVIVSPPKYTSNCVSISSCTASSHHLNFLHRHRATSRAVLSWDRQVAGRHQRGRPTPVRFR